MDLDSAVLYSSNVPAAAEFYRDFVGLKVDFVDGERFAQFSFENGGHLSIKKQVEGRECPGCQTVFITIDNVEEVYERMKEKGADFKKHLTEEPWATHFSVYDTDKNKVEFLRRK